MPGLSTWPTQGGAGLPTHGGAVGPDQVQVRRPLRDQDVSGGRTLKYPDAWEPEILSATVAAAAKVRTVNMEIFAREGELIKYTVTLAIRLSFRDQVLWLETGDVLNVVHVIAGGTKANRTWDHLCEERGG